MDIAIFCKNRQQTRVVVDKLKLLWGQRGVAVYAADYHAAAREAALAAYHVLNLTDKDMSSEVREDLVETIVLWGDNQDGNLWYRNFRENTDRVLSDWREKCLPYFFVVHGFRDTKEISRFTNSLRVGIGRNYLNARSFLHMGFSGEENTDEIAEAIVKHCAKKMNGIFDESERVPADT